MQGKCTRSTRWATQAGAAGLTVGIATRDGIPYHEIVTLAQDSSPDLIMEIARVGPGRVNRTLLGSVADGSSGSRRVRC